MGVYHWDAVCVVFHESDGMGLISFGIMMIMYTFFSVIIDEIQQVPALLNEVHWLITNKNTRFILSGSSPRKILRSGSNSDTLIGYFVPSFQKKPKRRVIRAPKFYYFDVGVANLFRD